MRKNQHHTMIIYTVNSCFSWYFPELNKEQARTILQNGEAGVFLVRFSSSSDPPNPVLSVCRGNQKIFHFTIVKVKDGKFEFGGVMFNSLHDILVHFSTHPLSEDGLLKLTQPADVRYFVKGNSPKSDRENFLYVEQGQILKLMKRNETQMAGEESQLWLMENEKGEQGLVASCNLLVYVPSEYDSFMQRHNTDSSTTHRNSKPSYKPAVPQKPFLRTSSVSSSPFSEIKTPGNTESMEIPMHGSSSKPPSEQFDIPSEFPFLAVAIADRNPNFYDRSQLRFKKGDKLEVSRPEISGDDPLKYGWAEAVNKENGQRGFIPIFSSYVAWLSPVMKH